MALITPHFLKEDRRALVVPSVYDIESYMQDEDIRAIVAPYRPFTRKQLYEILSLAVEIKSNQRVNYQDLFRYPEETIPTPVFLNAAFEELSAVFFVVTGKSPVATLRLNSSIPTRPHGHRPSMTFTPLGISTLGMNEDKVLYPMPKNHACFMKHNFPHMASQDHSHRCPKLTMLIA